MKRYCIAVIVLLLTLVSFSLCLAGEGLVIEAKGGMSSMGMGGTSTDSRLFITTRGACEIDNVKPEGVLQFMSNYLSDIIANKYVIMDFEKKVGWSLDTLAKTYKEEDLSAPPVNMPISQDTGFMAFDPPKEEQSGIYIWTTIRDSSDTIKYVNGFPCKKYSIQSTPKGDDTDSSMVITTFWICDSVPEPDIYGAYQSFQRYITGEGNNNEENSLKNIMDVCIDHAMEVWRRTLAPGNFMVKYLTDMKITNEKPSAKSEIDLAETDLYDYFDSSMMEYVKQMVIDMKSKDENKPDDGLISLMSFSYEVLNVKQQMLPDSLFEIPEGYTLK